MKIMNTHINLFWVQGHVTSVNTHIPLIVGERSSMRCVTCGNYWKTWRDKLYASRLSRPLRCWNYCDMQHMTSIKLTYTSCFDLILIHISTFPNVCKWGPWEKWLWYMTSINLTYISSVDLTRSYKDKSYDDVTTFANETVANSCLSLSQKVGALEP